MTILPTDTDFHVHDLTTLEWYVRQVAAKHAEMDTIRAQSGAMIKDLQREIDHLEFLYGAQAQTLLERLLEAKRGNSKHLKTFYGNIGFRTIPAKLQVRDAAQTLEWARENAPDLLETTVNRIALTRRFTATADGGLVNPDGEPLEIPGVTVAPAEERLYIKTPTATSSDDLA
jgi:phage host-nuclease inhibitor protein Gam